METWLVTGASRGVGRALSLRLAQSGRRVFALARDLAALERLAAEACPGAIVAEPVDLADRRALGAALIRLSQSCDSFDGVINNAGIGWFKPFLQHSEDELADLLQINLHAVMQICWALLPGMLACGRGQIINIGSDLGRRPLANMAAYVASKHGLAGFSHSLLREVKDRGVRVSLINPGIIDTGFGGGEYGHRDPRAYLKPDALTALIMQLIEQPESMVVDELSVHPLMQAEF